VDGIQFLPRGAFLPGANALVVADLHVGRAEASDVAFPLGECEDLCSRLRALLDAAEPATVVFAGDVLHRFDAVTERTRETVADLVAVCEEASSRPVFVRGNHDAAIDSVRETIDAIGETIDSVGESVSDAYVVAEEPRVVACHGHEAPSLDADRYVIGHDHPAIAIEGQRRPCFLHAPDAYRDADVLMLPAFSRLAAGVEINDASAADLQSPLLRELDDVRPIVYDEAGEEALEFPPLGSFRGLL
jgi:putative SbcD/Mre11-related phosphoesterase